MHDRKFNDPSVAFVPSLPSHIGAFRSQRTRAPSAFGQVVEVCRDMAGIVFLLLLSAAAILALRHPSIGLRYLRDHSAGFTDSFSGSLQRDKDWLAHQQWRETFSREQQMTFSQRMNRWHVMVADASERFHIPAKWIRTVMQIESGGRTMLSEKKPITSPVGAVGLMQLMPGTYEEMRAQHKLGADPYNPRDNIMAGAAYLSWLHHKYGYPAMFVAYNDGPGNLEAKQSKGRALPVETRNYVAKICATLGTAVPSSFARADRARLTRPNGEPLWIDAAAVAAVRAPLRGEYSGSVKSVVTIGHSRQALRETVAMVRAALHTRSG